VGALSQLHARDFVDYDSRERVLISP